MPSRTSARKTAAVAWASWGQISSQVHTTNTPTATTQPVSGVAVAAGLSAVPAPTANPTTAATVNRVRADVAPTGGSAEMIESPGRARSRTRCFSAPSPLTRTRIPRGP